MFTVVSALHIVRLPLLLCFFVAYINHRNPNQNLVLLPRSVSTVCMSMTGRNGRANLNLERHHARNLDSF